MKSNKKAGLAMNKAMLSSNANMVLSKSYLMLTGIKVTDVFHQ